MEEELMRVFFFVLLTTFIWCSATIADEKLPDISKMSDKEFNNLPKDVQDKIPLKEIFKRAPSGDMTPTVMLTVSFSLAKLMYFNPVPEKQVREAIKKFQRDIGQDQTGELTMGQLNELSRRANRLSDNPIYVPGLGETLDVIGEEDYVTTEGTWTIEGEKHAFPINFAKINCFKSRGTCEINQVNISIPRLNNSSQGFLVAHTPYTEELEIISWANNEIVSQGDIKCRTTIMTINIENNEVFQITRNKGNERCLSLPQLKKPRIARLNPGTKFAREFWNSRKEKTNKYINTEVQEQIKALSKIFNSTKEDKKNKTQNNSKPE